MKKFGISFAAILVLAVAAAALVLVRFDLSHEALVDKYANEASGFVQLPDGAVAHYRDQGQPDGSVLLLLHGATASLHTWEPWMRELGMRELGARELGARELGDRFRIVSVDLPGHGLTGRIPSDDYGRDSMVEFVRDFMTEIGIERFAVAGHSMGGGVAAQFAADYPLRVRGLILVSPDGLPPDEPGEPPLMVRLAATPVVRDAMRYLTPWALVDGALRPAMADQSLVTPDMTDRYYDLLLHEGNRVATIERFAQLAAESSLEDRLGEIAAPTLIIWGAQDRLIPVATADRFTALIPHSRLVIYEQAGHVAMEEVAVESAGEVRAFLDDL